MPYLKVVMESPLDQRVEFIQLEGYETPDDLQQIAEDAFCNWANFGYETVDKPE